MPQSRHRGRVIDNEKSGMSARAVPALRTVTGAGFLIKVLVADHPTYRTLQFNRANLTSQANQPRLPFGT